MCIDSVITLRYCHDMTTEARTEALAAELDALLPEAVAGSAAELRVAEIIRELRDLGIDVQTID